MAPCYREWGSLQHCRPSGLRCPADERYADVPLPLLAVENRSTTTGPHCGTLSSVRALRAEELWAARCIRDALPGVLVEQHDDGSARGMHDLDIFYEDGRVGAAEVTIAVDRGYAELSKLIRPTRWIVPSIRGGWLVRVLPSARARKLRRHLPALLDQLEHDHITEFDATHDSLDHFVNEPRSANDQARELGVAKAWQARATSFPGSIYVEIELPPEHTGGWSADTGDGLATWISEWVTDPDRIDNRKKLAKSGAPERHLFVIVTGLSGCPFSAFDILFSDDAPSPLVSPELPSEFTNVWIASTTLRGFGFRWSAGGGWQRFDKPSDAQ